MRVFLYQVLELVRELPRLPYVHFELHVLHA
jgi:hypothetical protein